MNKLTDNDKQTKLKAFFENGWKLDESRDAINKEFQFKNFIEAFSWMTKVGFPIIFSERPYARKAEQSTSHEWEFSCMAIELND